MTRVIFLVGVIVLVALAASWLNANPGDVSVQWLGWRIDTSVAMLAFFVILVTVLGAVGYHFWRSLRDAPGRFFDARRTRRNRLGYEALSSGMIAAAAGDSAEAQKQARRAENLLADAGATRLLRAQAARLGGDVSTARRTYEEMAENPDTALIGLCGLLDQAEERGDKAEALRLAEKAHRVNPRAQTVERRLFDLQIAFRQWAAADQTVSDGIRAKLFPATEAKRWRAAILIERSRQSEQDGEIDAAFDFAREAHQLGADDIPAAVQYGRLLGRQGKTKRAQRVLERIWSQQPHPEIAAAYATLFETENALSRVKRFQRLLSFRPDHADGHVALAQAALEAALWGEARAHLAQAAEKGLTPRVCRLFAELEEAEHGDDRAARRWLEKAAMADGDAAWICDACGAASGSWSALCGNCGAFDTLQWLPPRRGLALPPGETVVALPSSRAEAESA